MITLIRHGKTKGNLERRYIGSTEESLCEEGVLALKECMARMPYPKTDHVFSSPMKRCLETAALIYPNANVTICDDLREISFGDCEGKTYDEILSLYGEFAFRNGEDVALFKKRVRNAFFAIAEQSSECVIICHGGVIMTVMETIFGGDFYDWHVSNGCGYKIEICQGIFCPIGKRD